MKEPFPKCSTLIDSPVLSEVESRTVKLKSLLYAGFHNFKPSHSLPDNLESNSKISFVANVVFMVMAVLYFVWSISGIAASLGVPRVCIGFNPYLWENERLYIVSFLLQV